MLLCSIERKLMDYILRAIDKKQTFRLFMVRSTNTVEEARKHHNTAPTASAALGRTISAGLMMGYKRRRSHRNNFDRIRQQRTH